MEAFTNLRPAPVEERDASVDNLKVVLVAAVIVGHATIAWTGMGNWVMEEPHVREPLLSIASLLMVGALFGMATFFLIAGMFTAPSLARKGTGRFLADRAVRLGVPLVFFVVVLSPFVEYVDSSNVGWDRGFWAFTWEIWWPPAPGPTWFLWVLLLFSLCYALFRRARPAPREGARLTGAVLLGTAAVVGLAAWTIRLVVPLGEEVWRISLSQVPAWVAAFTLGVLGGERGWFRPMPAWIASSARRTASVALAAAVLVLALGVVEGRPDRFAGGMTWESAVLAAVEGALVVSMPLWLLDVFRRRFSAVTRLMQEASRAAFAAFVVHQAVLVGFVLLSRLVAWPAEVEYFVVSLLAVAGSFGIGWLAVKIPAVARIV